MLQTPQLLSAPIWDLSWGPGSALLFHSAISLCQWSFWGTWKCILAPWLSVQSKEDGMFLLISRAALMLLRRGAVGGSGHWAIQWIPTVAQINLWLTSTQLWVQEDFSSFPTGTQGTACRKWQNVLLDVPTDRKCLQLIFVSSPGWKSK